jgi:SAM-dependent methyltransferase
MAELRKSGISFAAPEAACYDAIAQAMPHRYAEAHRIQNDLVTAALRRAPEQLRVLEIGPGTCTDLCRILDAPHARKLAYLGWEQSEEMVKIGRRKLPSWTAKSVRIECVDAIDAIVRAAESFTFDICFSAFVYHHMEPADRLVVHKAAIERLRAGGLYIITDLFKPSGDAAAEAAADEIEGVQTAVRSAKLPSDVDAAALLNAWTQHYTDQNPPALVDELKMLIDLPSVPEVLYADCQVHVIAVRKGEHRT